MRPHTFVLSYLFRRPVFVTFSFIYFVLNWSIDIVMILCLIMVALAVIDFYMIILCYGIWMTYNIINVLDVTNIFLFFLAYMTSFQQCSFFAFLFFYILLCYDDLSYSISHVVYELGNAVKIEGELTVLL